MPQVSRGLADGDLFHHEALDIVVENRTGGPQTLEANTDPRNHRISLRLQGVPNYRLALNAKVCVTLGKLTQMQEIRSGGSYLSQSEITLHFGLGLSKQVDNDSMEWQGGAKQTFSLIEADRFYTLR